MLYHICKIEKNCDTLGSIVEYVDKTINPFSDSINKDSLFNVVTGRAASERKLVKMLAMCLLSNVLKIQKDLKKQSLAFCI